MSYILKPGKPTMKYTVFLSSGNDAVRLRNRAHELLNIASYQVSEAGFDLHIAVKRWEETAARRADTGVNEIFVRMAEDSHVTLVLLLDEIRPGTKEEFEAVLAIPNVQLAVLWFDNTDGEDSAEAGVVREFLEAHENEIVYKRAGHPDSDQAWLEIGRVVLAAVASIVRLEGKTPPGRLLKPTFDEAEGFKDGS